GSTSVCTFPSNGQSIHRLEIDNSGTTNYSGTGTILTTQQLAVTLGTGNLNINSGQVIVASAGSFAISAGLTLNKKGAGLLTVNSSQSHGAGALFDVQAGTATINSDCGSAASRTLTVQAEGNVNFFSNEHVASLFANVGTITVAPSGSRILVT